MDIFQRLNVERGITVILITHEHDIAEYGTRVFAFRDGHIVSTSRSPPPQGGGRTGGAAAAGAGRRSGIGQSAQADA